MNNNMQHALTRKGMQTQEKVIVAGVECIAALGFHTASTNKIAQRAGVTWGTLQHQFGDKATLLETVLDHAFNEQIETLRRAIHPGQPLEERINDMLNAFWQNQN